MWLSDISKVFKELETKISELEMKINDKGSGYDSGFMAGLCEGKERGYNRGYADGLINGINFMTHNE